MKIEKIVIIVSERTGFFLLWYVLLFVQFLLPEVY
jgi:hypothetical protein